MKKLLSKNNLIILFFLLIALFLRLYKLSERTSFDADQEWLMTRSQAVLSGDLALLGPVTSVGNFSIGPAFIYFLSFINVFTSGAPISEAYLSVFLGILTIIGLFVFTKYFIDEKTAYIVLFLSAISSTLIFYDQMPWAPSLFYIAQIIILSGAYLVRKNQLGYLLIAIGISLGFSSHFGIVLSVLSIIIYLILVKPVKPTNKVALMALGILVAGFLPNIIFDISHNFINFKRLLDIIHGDGISYFVSFGKIVSTLAYSSISLIYPRNVNVFDLIILKMLFALILVNGASHLRDKKYKDLAILLLVTIIIPSLIFYVQQGKFSEYYLMMTTPSSIFLLALFIKDVLRWRLMIVILLITSIYLNYSQLRFRRVPWNLNAKESIAKIILEKAGSDNYGISLTTGLGEQFGFEYIFNYYGVEGDLPPKKGETRIFSIILPEGLDGMYGMIDIDGIGLRWSGI